MAKLAGVYRPGSTSFTQDEQNALLRPPSTLKTATPDLSWIGKAAMDPTKGSTPMVEAAAKGGEFGDLSWIGKLAMDPSKGGGNMVRGAYQGAASRPGDDAWGQALAAERARIDAEVQAWTEQWNQQYDADTAAMEAQLEDISQKLIYHTGLQNKKIDEMVAATNAGTLAGSVWNDVQKWIDQNPGRDIRDYWVAKMPMPEGIQELSRNYFTLSNQLTERGPGRQAAFDTARNEKFGEAEKNYLEADELARGLRGSSKQQSEFDAAYEEARKRYENAVTQYDKDRAAWDLYKAEKARYDQDVANRQADIDAGKYAVNPYQFLAQGANINEIEELRQQVNAGNLRPNMRVPDELVAPTEVRDPGAFTYEGGQPVREYADTPTGSQAAMDILGYKPPPPPKQDKALPEVSTEKTDTSSVDADYKYDAPLDYQDREKEKPDVDKSGNPVIKPPTTNNLQQTGSTSGSSTQATPTTQVTAAPAPALPEQPAGTVGGQQSNTGQDPEVPAEKKPEEKPEPFTPDEEEKENKDNVWQ